MMELFINGVGCVSPQSTFDNSVFLPEIREYSNNCLFCVEPDYSSFFDPAGLRRMSHVIKFSTAAAFIALRDAGVAVPGAISTGTGYGLLETSLKFLKSVIEQDEAAVSPTSFIQSTHNTIGGIIALMTGCHGHNNTFTQKSISFECALNDARLVMSEDGTDNYLVGGFDELTAYGQQIMTRLDILRKEPCSNLELYHEKGKGIIAGEGAAFFVLSKNKSATSYGKLVDSEAFILPPSGEDVKYKITTFLERNNLTLSQLDTVITGLCGDTERDALTTGLNETFFSTQTITAFKHLCGEYMTSSAFAFWLAAKMMKTNNIPDRILRVDRRRKPQNILVFNSYEDHHSLILFQSC